MSIINKSSGLDSIQTKQLIDFLSNISSQNNEYQIVESFMLTVLSTINLKKIFVITYEDSIIIKNKYEKNFDNKKNAQIILSEFRNKEWNEDKFLQDNEFIGFKILEFDGKRLGKVFWENKPTDENLSESEIIFINAICEVLSLALYNLSLVEKTNKLSRLLLDKSQKINNLLELSKQTSRTADENKAAKIFAFSIIGHFGAKRLLMILKRKESFEVKFNLGYDLNNILQEKVSFQKNSTTLYFDDIDLERVENEIVISGSNLIVGVKSNEDLSLYVILGEKIKKDIYREEDKDYLFLIAKSALGVYENIFYVSEIIERKKIEEELSLAKKTQQNLFPKKYPLSTKFEFYGKNAPTFQVGGDYYDVIELNDDEILILIADVSGKGFSAALTMSNLQAYIKAFVKNGLSFDNIIQNAISLNNLICENLTEGSFITMFWGVIKISASELNYVNAGHNYPLFFRGNEILRLKEGGLPLGVLSSFKNYKSGRIKFSSGDILLAYTDGITEAKNLNDEEYGEEKLISVVIRNSHLKAYEIAEKIFSDNMIFSQGLPQYDDKTLLLVKAL